MMEDGPAHQMQHSAGEHRVDGEADPSLHKK